MDCPKTVRRGYLVCALHWWELPAEMRTIVHRHWNRRGRPRPYHKQIAAVAVAFLDPRDNANNLLKFILTLPPELSNEIFGALGMTLHRTPAEQTV